MKNSKKKIKKQNATIREEINKIRQEHLHDIAQSIYTIPYKMPQSVPQQEYRSEDLAEDLRKILCRLNSTKN